MAEDVKDAVDDDLDEDLDEKSTSGEAKDETAATQQSGDETVAVVEDPERVAIRDRRRQEKEDRKRRQREAINRRDRHIQGLERTVADLSSKVEHLANRTSGSDMARVDAAIDTAAQEIELSSAAMEEALKAGDAKIHREAMEAWYNSKRKQEELISFKRQVTTSQRQPAAGGGAVRAAQPDPELVVHARNWVKDNKWYDPRLGDEDSRIAHVIDQGMVRDGYDPRTKEYWDELTDRVKERLPRHFQAGGTVGGGNGQRQITGSGSGRESPGGSARVTISAERIAGMRDAGIDWDDPKVRSRMIQRFQTNDKELAR